jgi:Uma2 family endonuclease
MSVAVSSSPVLAKPAPAVPSDYIWRMSVEQYHAIIQAGILTEDDQVELLEGWLIPQMTKNPPHRMAVRLIHDALARLTPVGWYVDAQEPITLADSEPEPDISVVRGDTRQYWDRHPGAAEVALVIEVADATLQRDRGIKRSIYARAGIAVYWIVNLLERRVEVYTEPTAESANYQQRHDYGLDSAVPVFIDGQQIGVLSVRELLP